MDSKEIIRRVVAHDSPPRFGFDFQNDKYNDFSGVSTASYIYEDANPYNSWGSYDELLKLTGFHGEVRRDYHGNIYGRFNGKTKGECIRGAIQSWDDIDAYKLPKIDYKHRDSLLSQNLKASDKYIMCWGPSIFSDLRDARLIPNALADTALEPEMVEEFLNRVTKLAVETIESISGCGIDAMLIGDDWGTQDRTFISPEAFRELFKPFYKRICDALHNIGMSCFMHSCGYIYKFIPDLIDAGVDVFQFDQPDVYPSEVLAKEFGSKVAFYCPVDIQKIMPTGEREIIERRAREMCEIFRDNCGGAMIFKDYPTWNDLNVNREWADWAMNTIVSDSAL